MSNITQLAQQIRQGLQATANVDELAMQLVEQVYPLERPAVIDVGARLWLVVLPGWTPSKEPTDFVHIGDQLS